MQQDSQAGISAAGTTDELWKALLGYFHGTEVEKVSYLHLPPLGAPDNPTPELRAHGFHADDVARYLEDRLYQDNPVLALAQKQVRPVYWDEIADEDLAPREREFVEELRLLHAGNGVGMPVYGPDGRRGQCGLGFVPGVERLAPERLHDFWQVCALAHLRFCALLLPTLAVPALTRRETQVLNWVARGKSNQSIGDILGISGSTVDAHLRRIYLKFGVFDRISAAVRGLGVGLIHSTV